MGYRIRLFFPFDVIFELKTGREAESGNYSYEWERDFVFWWGWDVGLEGETEWHTGFQFLPDLKLLFAGAKTASWQKRTFCTYSCARFQVMNSDCLYPVRFCQTCPLSLDHVSILRFIWSLSVSFQSFVLSPNSDICPLPALLSVILEPRFFLVFLVFRPFPER